MIKLARATVLAIVTTALASGTARAEFFIGSINAHFENPVLTGSVYLGGGSFNNTSSARYTIYGNGPIAAINWGTNAGAPGSSTLVFSPNQNVAVFDDVEFQLGTVTLYNGTSTLESLIFGIDLVLDFIPAGGGPAVDTLTLRVGIGTTFNVGDASANADFVSIPGIAHSFFAFEGLGATANVFGRIVSPQQSSQLSIAATGDAQLVPESFQVVENFLLYTGPETPRPYDPADYTTYDSPGFAGGFTGPTPVVPEPGSLVLLATGAFSCLGLSYFRRSKTQS